MSRPTMHVPLFKQPPVYIVLVVVLVSLVPLGFHLLGGTFTGAEQAPPPEPRETLVAALSPAAGLDRALLRCPDLTLPEEALDPESVLDDEAPLGAIAMALEEAQPDDDAPVEIVIIDDFEREPPRRPKSARGLLGQARRAYAQGQSARAYRYAERSHSRRPTHDAKLVQTKAACELKDRPAARAAYRDLPRGDVRKEARRACRANGILLL